MQLREFEGIVEQLLRLRANKFNTTKHAVGVPSTFRNDESLRQVFLDFCQHDVVGSAHKPSTMQPSQFAALCKDCGLKDKAHPLPVSALGCFGRGGARLGEGMKGTCRFGLVTACLVLLMSRSRDSWQGGCG